MLVTCTPGDNIYASPLPPRGELTILQYAEREAAAASSRRKGEFIGSIERKVAIVERVGIENGPPTLSHQADVTRKLLSMYTGIMLA